LSHGAHDPYNRALTASPDRAFSQFMLGLLVSF
jgi:hypothetical protein